MIENWQPENFPASTNCWPRYETFEPSLAVIAIYLEQARGRCSFAGIGGRAGLFFLD
jgi:hypothetical protein